MMFDVLCRFRDSTTNTIRGFNRQLRKVTKSKTVFSSDDSLIKMLYLAMMDITKKWTGHRQDLRDIISTCSVTLSLTKSPEAFGKSTLEALALGRPVAGYAHGGVKEQLDAFLPEGNIAVGDASSMAALLSRWYAQPPPLPRHIPSPYKMEDMIQAHLDVYQELTPYS